MTSPKIDSQVYVAEFIDGPLEGQIESRYLVRGRHSPRISMVAAVEGLESLFWYDEVEKREFNGRLHVRYAFDATESDPFEPNDEPG